MFSAAEDRGHKITNVTLSTTKTRWPRHSDLTTTFSVNDLNLFLEHSFMKDVHHRLKRRRRRSQKDSPDAGFKPLAEEEKKDSEDLGNEDSEVPCSEEPRANQEKDANVNSINNINCTSGNFRNFKGLF
ncbi:hypothetical protein Tco_0241225 [Tanacetum coccineum]